MTNIKLRQRILSEAARLIYRRQETNCNRAKIKAARKICRGWVKPVDLPTDREIHAEVQRFSQPARSLSGFVREAEEHETNLQPDGNAETETNRLLDRELVSDWDSEEIDATSHDVSTESKYDEHRFEVYRTLLLPLEDVRQNRKSHPEGDALYHSLQVFTLACDKIPYDEDFLLAALLHDVGKGIDPRDHVWAGLDALNGFISERIAWLIEHHSEARALLSGTIGVRAHRRLRQSEDYDELLILTKCDRAGRVPGADVPELDDALDSIRSLATMYE